jgi:aminoglycoside phosphotransferase family enzyme
VPASEGSTNADVVETHVSILFFVGDRVYKLRKAIQFGFLDSSQTTTRQEDSQSSTRT